jgi:MFS family permease
LLVLSRLGTPGDVLVEVLPGLVVAAFGIGAVLVTGTTTAFGQVGDEESGRASGFVNTAHEVGVSLGVALSSTVGGASLTAGPASAGGGFGGAFLAACLVAAAGLLVARSILPTTARASGRSHFGH